MAGLPSAFVWGNNDWDRDDLERYAKKLGIACHGAMADLQLGGKRFAVIHGDDFSLKQRILAEQKHDYLLQGHTHIRSDQKVGKIRCINPGAMYRAAVKTVAILDTATDGLTFFTVEGF